MDNRETEELTEINNEKFDESVTIDDEIEFWNNNFDEFLDNDSKNKENDKQSELEVESNISNEIINNKDNNIIEENIDSQTKKQVRKKMPEFFIGKNYKKITTKKFSFAGFFFGGTYFLYRKMYLEGIILIVITYLLSIAFPTFLLLNGYQSYTFIPYLLLFILNIFIGFMTNKIYKNFVIRKMKKIRALHLSYEESAQKCQKTGGTSFIKMIIVNIVISGFLASLIQGILISQFNNIEDINSQEGVILEVY